MKTCGHQSASVLAAILTVLMLGCGDKPAAPKGDGHGHDEHGHDHDEHGHEHEDGGHEEADHDAEGEEEGEHAHEEHGDEVSFSSSAIQHYGIRTEAASARVLVPTVQVPAQVAFNREGIAHVGSPVRGRVAELSVKLGQEVTRGETLLIVESPELGEAQSEYLQKRALVSTAGPIVVLLKDAYERARGLLEKSQGITLTEVQKREAEYRTAEAELRNAETAERAVRNRLSLLAMTPDAIKRLEDTGALDPRFTITAPISGQVIEREATLGELVGPDRERLLSLADMTKLWVLAKVPEAKLNQIVVGAKARLLLGTAEDHRCEGKVVYVSPSLDHRTRTADVRIEAEDRHPELRPGIFAQAEIELSMSPGAANSEVLAVPDEAVMNVEGATCVFVSVQGEEGTFAKRVVSVGEAIGGFRPVFTGLAAGENVVVSGTFLLKAELGKGSAAHEH